MADFIELVPGSCPRQSRSGTHFVMGEIAFSIEFGLRRLA
jgi:hypothetical protein